MPDIRRIIIDAMIHRGISQSELARRIGVTPGQINRYCTGKHDFSGERIGKILDVLGLEFNEKKSR